MFEIEEELDIDLESAVRGAGASGFWSEFHEDTGAQRWKALAISATVAVAVGVGIWYLAQRRR